MKQKRTASVFQLNLILALAGGLLVLWSFVKEPSESGSAVFFGFSYLRLIAILMVVALLLLILGLLFIIYRRSWPAQANESFGARLVNQNRMSWISLLWIAASYVLLFLSERQLGSLAPYRARLFPILLWFAALSVQFGFVILYLKGMNGRAIREYRGVLLASLATLVLLGFLLALIIFTHVGLLPDQVQWQAAGAPVLWYQVLLAAIAGVLLHVFIGHIGVRRSIKLDLVIFLSLWGFASLVWLHEPANFTWFSLKPTPPNYQSYPFSDALLYDGAARAYLIGKPIPSDFWMKPFYSFFIALLHLLAGGNYALLISLQVIFLALIPALVYLLTTRLDARPAGLVAGLLFVLREQNALALSNVIQISHVKLLLSDVFAMGFMVLLLWLFFHWLENPGERRVTPLVLGGVFGLLVLTRGHPIILLPFILCAMFFVPFSRPRLRWETLALTCIGFLIPLVPWLWRNYESTGKVAFQQPASPYSVQISAVYSFEPSVFDPNNLPRKYPDESDPVYYERLQRQTIRFTVEHPDQVAKFVSAHYFHNLIFSYIYLPYSFQIEGVKDYVKTHPFWNIWEGNLSFQEAVMLFINLVVISLGLGYLWKKYKYLALVPLFLGIGYNLSVSVARVSGWRFILPADWITLIYYAVGLMQLYQLLRALTSQEAKFSFPEWKIQDTFQPLKRISLIGFILLFLAIGVALTQGQKLFSRHYPNKSVSQLKEDYLKISSILSASVRRADLDEFLKTENAVIAYGQALNPSFVKAQKEGLDSTWTVYYFWPNYRPKPFSRLIFNLNGPSSAGVVLPMKAAPSSFPDGADVIVVGCRAESGEIDARLVLMPGTSPVQLTSEPLSTRLACP